jgi:transposase
MSVKYKITLTDSERVTLRSVISKSDSKSKKKGKDSLQTSPVIKTPPRVKNAYILLASEDVSLSNATIASRYCVSVRCVEKLRKRFVEEGFEVALSGKQVGGYRTSKYDGRVEAHLVSLRCSDAPAGYNKWTLRLLADKMVELNYVDAISKDSVDKLLKKTNLSLGRSNNG